MGGGTWTKKDFASYSASVGRTVAMDGAINTSYASAQDMFKSRRIADALNPKNAVRECCDTAEHPNTIPVILALDVTGSMGSAAMEVAKKLNVVMTKLYENVEDVEFLIMGIGDLAYDSAPIQASQFESDIRIAEQLDKIYFEGGGGGNSFESYTAAWYFGLHHTKLDCWERGKKGIIITMGDEPLNPYLPCNELRNATGDSLQGEIETEDLYKKVITKFDVYHLMVDDIATCFRRYEPSVKATWGRHLDGQHLLKVTLNSLADTIVDIVTAAADYNHATGGTVSNAEENKNNGIAW